jgi:hypothetical protein
VLTLVSGGVAWVVRTRPGPSPVGVTASSVSSNSILLSWSRPRTGAAPQRYAIRRNGVEVARIGVEPSYRDSAVQPLKTYRYSVLAVVDGRLSHPTDDLVVRTPPASPSGLTSGEVTTTTAVVSWAPPPGTAPDRYVVRRDGDDLATVSGTTLTYKDSSLRPLVEVSYSVVAVFDDQRSDPTPPLQVTTQAPPVSQARLQDSWDVTLKVTKTAGTRLKTGDSETDTWTFTPKCADGACPVDVSANLGGQPFTITLNRNGAVYKGSAKAHIARCRNINITNTVSLTIRVTAGEMIDDDWAASNWTGSFSLSIPYTRAGSYYCPAQTATFSVIPDAIAPDSAPPGRDV